MFTTLLSPLDHGRLWLRNRVVFPGHQTLYSRDGEVSDRLRAYYVERAKGGVAAVVVEGGAMHPTTIKFPDYLRFYDAEVMPSVRRLADELHEHGAKVFVQVAHSGSRMATMDSRQPLWAPSDVKSGNAVEIPHAMTHDDIATLLEGYRVTAELLAATGIDGIEIHAAHEYLLGEFLSPHNNRRDDEYGGSLENRTRLTTEVIDLVRRTVGDDLVVGVRMNGSDRRPDGNTNADYVAIARLLDATGDLDYLSISAGTSVDNGDIVPPMDVPQGVNVDEAAAIHAAVSAAVFTVGRIKRPEHAEQVLADGKADVVAMARALIADPDYLRKVADDPSRIRPCVGANDGCYGRLVRVRPISCVVNPEVGLERELGAATRRPTDQPRSVVVVGGGPAGLEVARVAADRGHRVRVLEAAAEAGGQLRLASSLPARRELWEFVAFQLRELARLGVDIATGVRADAALLRELHPDAVVVATGSRPRHLEIPVAADAPEILSVPDAIERASGDVTGAQVVVIDGVGHMPAYVPAEHLLDAGAAVSIVSGAPVLGAALEETTQARTLRRLAGKGARLVTASAPVAVTAEGVRVRDVWSGEERTVPATLVVAAIPNVVDDALVGALAGAGLEVHAIGDTVAPRTMLEAVREGQLTGRAL